MIRGSHTVLIRTISPVGHGAEASSPAGHRTLTQWSCSIKSWHRHHSFLNSLPPTSHLPPPPQGGRIKEGVIDLLALQFFEPFLNVAQLISKIIRPFFKKANLYFFGWRPPWWNGCSVPPGVPTPTSPIPIRMVSPSRRSHSVWHSDSPSRR